MCISIICIFYLLIVLFLLYYCYCIAVLMCWYIWVYFLPLLHDRRNYCLFILLRHSFVLSFINANTDLKTGGKLKGNLVALLCLQVLSLLVPLVRIVIANRYNIVLINHLHYAEIMPFFPDGGGLFQDVPNPIHSSQGFTQ